MTKRDEDLEGDEEDEKKKKKIKSTVPINDTKDKQRHTVNNNNNNNSSNNNNKKKRRPTSSSNAAARRILKGELCREMRPLAVGSVAMLASSWTNQALPRLMGALIDAQSTSNHRTSSSNNSSSNNSSNSNMTTSLGLVILGGGMASLIRTFMLNQVEGKIAARLRTQAVESLLIKKDLQWFQTAQLNNDSESSGNDNGKQENVQEQRVDQDASSSSENLAESASSSSEVKASGGVSPGAIGTVLEEDVNRLSACLTKTLTNLLRYSSSIVFSTYRMLCLDPALLGLSAAVVPVVGAAAILLNKTVTKVTSRQRQLATTAASFLEERLTHLAMVQMSHRQQDEVAAYTQLQHECSRLARTSALYQGCFMGFIFAASSGALLLVVHSGGRSVARGKMTSGQLTSFATYSFLLGLGTSGVMKTLGEWTQAMVSAERYERLVLTNDDNDDKEASASSATTTSLNKSLSSSSVTDNGIKVDVDAVESVSLRNLFFSYQSSSSSTHSSAKVLKDISFTLKRGQVVALVGRNGSGKSTMASILAGLYPPSSGDITLDTRLGDSSIDLNRVDQDCRKRLVQLIPQSTALFNTSILENVRYSNPQASIETVQRALQQAHCADLLAKLERQQQQQDDDSSSSSSLSASASALDFVVGLNGCKLSGGERQRLALARALVSDPMLLIMDEPASSMDASGEAAIYHAMEACRRGSGNDSVSGISDSASDGSTTASDGGRALLLITHDPKILQHADIILVLQNGEVVEQGTLDELLMVAREKNNSSHLLTLMPGLQQLQPPQPMMRTKSGGSTSSVHV